MKLRILTSVVIILAILIAVSLFLSRQSEPTADTTPPSEMNSGKKPRISTTPREPFRMPKFEQDLSMLSNNLEEEGLSEYARDLENPDLPEKDKVESIALLVFNLARYANVGYLPSCDNIDITNSLLGDNERKVAYLFADSKHINEHGELVDRWGTPYDFHCNSTAAATIRSAGPDKALYTSDDIVSMERE